jgi:hypothetical protein
VERHQRVMRFGMFVEILRQQNMRPDKHIATPEAGQQLAAVADVPDELGILLRLDRGDFLVEGQSSLAGMAAAEGHSQRLGVQVAGLLSPLLSLAPVRGQQQLAAIGQMECFVPIQHGLHKILTGRQLRQLAQGPAERMIIQHGGRSRRKVGHSETEQVGAVERLVGLHVTARLA